MCFLWPRTRWFCQELYPAGTERGRRAGGLVRAYSHRGGPIPMRRYAKVRVVVIRTLASDWDSPCSSDRSASKGPGMPRGCVCTTCTCRSTGTGIGSRIGRSSCSPRNHSTIRVRFLAKGEEPPVPAHTGRPAPSQCPGRARPSRRQPFLCSFRMVSSPRCEVSPTHGRQRTLRPPFSARVEARPPRRFAIPPRGPMRPQRASAPGALCQRGRNPAHEPHGGFGDRARVDHAPMLPAVRTHEKGLITGSSRLVQLTSRKCV